MTLTNAQEDDPGSADRSSRSAISYIRVSTKEQAERDGDPEGYSIPAQREAIERKAKSLGVQIMREFVDRGDSAKTADRPQLQRLLRFVDEEPGVTHVIVHKVDRLARNRMDDVTISFALRKAGVTLVSAAENIDETPSGMLMHGIMSSIAEFYSHNLATEVVKGMNQKAKIGGTPGKAPLGYRNVRVCNSEGREVRTIDLDPERAELIRWSFHAYATGDWTLTALAAELEVRGLTTRPTPKFPARPVRASHLYSILTHPYYKGRVVWRGAEHSGRHPRLVDDALWSRVQSVLEAHAPGEKQRIHDHYLKSSVFCGGCGSRLVITNAKNRYGQIYPYFVCVGRHQKRTSCTRKAILISVVESLVEDFYADVSLDDDLRDHLETTLVAQLEASQCQAMNDQRDLETQRQGLANQRIKLLQAHYAGAVPLDLLKSEQHRIGQQLEIIEARLSATTAHFHDVRKNLTAALDFAVACHRAYLEADGRTRRLLNQALFEKLYIDDGEASGEPLEPFQTLLGTEAMATVGRGTITDAPTTDATSSASPAPSTGVWTRSSIGRSRRRTHQTNRPAATDHVQRSLKATTQVRPARFELATS
ncbi:MAG: recombinase family protein [Frankiales bacterium]|nr:recombinase family protein [Frankiales bacterium]